MLSTATRSALESRLAELEEKLPEFRKQAKKELSNMVASVAAGNKISPTERIMLMTLLLNHPRNPDLLDLEMVEHIQQLLKMK